MANDEQPEGHGTLMIAALLVLGLAFASYWIRAAVSESGDHSAAPWFGVAAVAILVVAFLAYVRGGGGGGTR